MPIEYNRLKHRRFAPVEHAYGARETILYALGLGCGGDLTDESELRFVYEEGLVALPMMAVVLGYPGFWLRDESTGVDWTRVLHGEQGFVIHSSLPASGTVIGRTRVTDIIDKGEGRGALLFSEREVVDMASGARLATLTSTSFLRGDGGFGGPERSVPPPHALPDRAPDLFCDLTTLPQAALIYRLSGDYNPLHADPKIAAAAGFPRPILHGLCTFGVAGRAIIKACCGGDAMRLTSMQVRFSAPVFPGETIRTEIWREGARVSFRAKVVERDIVVLNNGVAEIAED